MKGSTLLIPAALAAEIQSSNRKPETKSSRLPPIKRSVPENTLSPARRPVTSPLLLGGSGQLPAYVCDSELSRRLGGGSRDMVNHLEMEPVSTGFEQL